MGNRWRRYCCNGLCDEGRGMSQSDFLIFYITTLTSIVGGFSYFVRHLIGQIRRLEDRVDEIYNILLERE